MAAQTTPKFNYGQLDPALRRMAQHGAEVIHRLLGRDSAGVVHIGRRLIAVRTRLGARDFRRWLEKEFACTPSVASNHMRVAERLGKLDCIGQFQPSALYALARHRVDARAIADAVRIARRGRWITRKIARALVAKYESGGRTKERAKTLRGLQRAIDRISTQVAQVVKSADPAELTLS